MDIHIYERFESTPDHPLFRVVVTTNRGLCYECTFAGDRPSEDRVRKIWRDDRKAFVPWSSTTGYYL